MEFNPIVQYFVRKHCTSQWNLRPETIPFHDLTFVVQGSATYHSQNGACQLQAGDAIFLPQGSYRSARTNGMDCIAFNFKGSSDLLPTKPKLLSWKNDDLLLHHFADFERAWMSMDESKELLCRGNFLLITHRLLELAKLRKGNPHVLEIQKYIEAHFKEHITVSNIAQHIGLNPTYCGAVYKKETGRTILQTVNQLRVDRAAALLEYGGARITDVALETGFSDLYYFSRVFKSIMGTSPEQFLRQKGL